MQHFVREQFSTLMSRLNEPRKFIQVLAGPRQVGKTTIVKQVSQKLSAPIHYASADLPGIQDNIWIEQQWQIARANLSDNPMGSILILDEIQKIPNWSEVVKKCWDSDSFHDLNVKVVLLGSAPLLLNKGLTESLAGRFELIKVTHWTFAEMQAAFDWSFEQYLVYGGYPGSASLIKDEKRWQDYILNTLIETTISRDILLMTRVDKPALLRRLFDLGCHYSGQILSYQKMLGQLDDAGNVTTLAHYLTLLASAGMVTGLEKFSGSVVRQRSSSPKLQVFNSGLITAQLDLTMQQIKNSLALRGRITESCIGAHFLNQSLKHNFKVYYWRERQHEVDFVIKKSSKIYAFEVKSGIKSATTSGMRAFQNKFNPDKIYLIGSDGIKIEKFLLSEVVDWL